MIAADIKEFISDKVCHPISYFQITFISAPVKVLKPNVIEFYLFLTIIQWTHHSMPPEFRKFSLINSYNLHDVIISIVDDT